MRVTAGRPGFSLVEVMVVVLIVGILVAIAVPVYRYNVRNSMAQEGLVILGQVRTAERLYFSAYSTYTDSWANIKDTMELGEKYFTNPPALTVGGSGSGATFTAIIAGTGDASGIRLTINEKGEIKTEGILGH
jgi:prepilin-type N-terminal cleavage/methylation domain-containing protein